MGVQNSFAELGFEELELGAKKRRLGDQPFRERLEEPGRSSFPRSLKFSLFLFLLKLAFHLFWNRTQ